MNLSKSKSLVLPAWTDYLLLFVLAAMQGSSFLLIKVAVSDLSPIEVVFFRLLIALIILYLLMRISNLSFPKDNKSDFWRCCILLGFTANIIPFYLITRAEVNINSGLASIYMSTIPMFTMLLAHYLSSDEKLTKKRVFGVLVSLIGVFILLAKSFSGASSGVVSQLLCLISAVFYAYSRIKTKRLSAVNPLVTSVGILFCAVIMLIPFSPLFISHHAPGYKTVLSVFLLGVFPTAIAYLIIYKLIATVGAVFMTNTNYLVPIFGILWGAILLSEKIDTRTVIAISVVLFGLWLAGRKSPS